eukprot:scaffold2657_cov89-Amphora_coffeaeformis.AAC.26
MGCRGCSISVNWSKDSCRMANTTFQVPKQLVSCVSSLCAPSGCSPLVFIFKTFTGLSDMRGPPNAALSDYEWGLGTEGERTRLFGLMEGRNRIFRRMSNGRKALWRVCYPTLPQMLPNLFEDLVDVWDLLIRNPWRILEIFNRRVQSFVLRFESSL